MSVIEQLKDIISEYIYNPANEWLEAQAQASLQLKSELTIKSIETELRIWSDYESGKISADLRDAYLSQNQLTYDHLISGIRTTPGEIFFDIAEVALSLPLGAASAVVGRLTASNVRLAQTTYSEVFSVGGIRQYSEMAGYKINNVSELSAAIRSGAISVDDVVVQIISRDSHNIVINTRTYEALKRAGVSD